MNKLYTKNELREEICIILNLLTIYRGYSTDEAADDILELVTTIELPTDEEIKEESKIGGMDTAQRLCFELGAKWMRDKIKGGRNL